MDIVRLRTLRELAHRGTMAATAEALGLTPSAISQHISALEDAAGVTLTQRDGRGVRLTPAGEVLAHHAQQMLSILDEARAELALLKADISGNLRVAAFASVSLALMPSVIAQLASRYPRLTIQLEEMEPNEGLAALKAWRSDIALIDDLSMLLDTKHDAISLTPLMQDSLYALVPDSHPLAAQTSCSLTDLRLDVWALDLPSSAFRAFVHSLCTQHGFEPRIQVGARSFETIFAMVAAGNAVSVAPGLWLKQPRRGVNVLALRPEAGRKISVAYRRGERHHPAIQVFIEETVKTCARLFGQMSQAGYTDLKL